MVQTKSRHHKTENTYHFLTLTERLATINVDIGKRINRHDFKPEETETYFYLALEKWVDLNYSTVFYEFTNRVKRKCHTLAQLIYNKDSLIETLTEFIAKADPLALQPVLDLTAQLARDLQMDFYAYFPVIFQAIVKTLDTQDTDVLEWSFQCLSYLFKFLWRYMLKDLPNVYNLYAPLLGELKKDYIRNFAAESFAFIMRKMNDKNELFEFLFDRLYLHPEESKGIGRLIFEMFKGVKQQFNSCTEQSLKVLLQKINHVPKELKEETDLSFKETIFSCLSVTLESMAEFTAKQHTSGIWRCFYSAVEESSKDLVRLFYVIRLMQIFVKHHDCYLVDDLDALVENICKIGALDLSSNPEFELRLTEAFFELCQTVLLSANLKFTIEKSSVIPGKLFQAKYDCGCICNLSKGLFEYYQFQSIILPNLIAYFENNVKSGAKAKLNSYDYPAKFVGLLASYLSRQNVIDEDFNEVIEQTVDQSAKNEAGFFIECLSKQKLLAQLVRTFDEKKFSNSTLHQKVVEHFGKRANELEKLLKSGQSLGDVGQHEQDVQLILISPFVLQGSDQTSSRLAKLTQSLLAYQAKTLEKEDSAEKASDLEAASFMLSLVIWALMLDRNSRTCFVKMLNDDGELSLKRAIEMLVKTEEYGRKARGEKNLAFLKVDKSLQHQLRALNHTLTAAKFASLADPKGYTASFKKAITPVVDLLKWQLASPYHEIRLTCLIILNNFFDEPSVQVKKPDEKGEADENETPLQVCMLAEKTPASLDEYRKKLYYLQRLEPSLPVNVEHQEVLLRYLFGALYENFKLLWDPMVELVQSYGKSMKANIFWDIFGKHLTDLSDSIEARFGAKRTAPSDEAAEDDSVLKQLGHLRSDEANIDYFNHRYLLCLAMQGFAQICENKTRVLVPVFFRFVENEYYAHENRLLSNAYEDLTVRFEDRADFYQKNKDKFVNKALLNKSLCAYLGVFAKFTQPKTWYQEERLRNLYLNLLCHHEASVQKAALDCIFTYNHAFINPYKEHLEKMLEGKHFRHELVVFSLDEASGIIHADHRMQLLPILMRIIYGKFHSHETTHTSSRDSKTNKRSTIIQFLSACSEYELNYFFNLLFDCVLSEFYRIDSTDGRVNESYARFEINNCGPSDLESKLAQLQVALNDVSGDLAGPRFIYNLARVVPLKKMLGILQSLEIILKKLARQMESYSHRILQMLCFLHKYAIVLFELGSGGLQKSSGNEASVVKVIDDHHLNLLKLIRQQTTLRFKQFFDTFDHLNFSQHEYFLVYDSFLWPQAVKIPTECLKSVSNLMKIFQLWSERSYYYPLFVVKLADFSSIPGSLVDQLLAAKAKSGYLDVFKAKNLLDVMFELIDSPKCAQGVVDFVLEIVHNLVTFADHKEEEETPMEQQEEASGPVVKAALPFDLAKLGYSRQAAQNEETNFGTIILKPYVASIVSHIEKIVTENMSKKVLPAKPLKILARISCFESNSQQQCEKIIQLLIPYLIKNRKQAEENELNILNSINHLLKQVRNVSDFVCPLSRLFSVIKNRQSRAELCAIFATIKTIDAKYSFIADLVVDLNSWDVKRIEEPDYMRRLDGFKRLNALVQSAAEFDLELASVLVYNCFYFINTIEDMAIKESSTNSVNLLLQKAASFELKKNERNFLEQNFASEIKNGLRNKMESARHELVAVLVKYVQLFKDKFTNLKDLAVLMDEEDVEKDFYENIKHIQMHRRSRALKRLQRACNENLISSENLLAYMMPLVRSFLDNEAYHKYDYLIEEASNSIGAICYVLSWPKYLKNVDYYLKLIPKNVLNQKLVIKVLISILDAFHFDLSLSTVKDYFTERFEADEELKDVGDPDEEDEAEEKDDDEKKEAAAEPQLTAGSGDPQARKKKLVSAGQACKIHTTVTKSIIPALFRCLTKRLKAEEEHKTNKHQDQDEQILRVPMALAILKLLKNLPKGALEAYLPNLLLKVCEMLKSRAFSVRFSTRECLMKMIHSLPDKKLYYYVFKELGNALTRGYQVHVLCYTIQTIFKNVQGKLEVGDLDTSLKILLHSVHLELFSDVAEEKEVKQIVAKVQEAKTTSSYNTLETLGKFVSKDRLLDLIAPFKQQLDECNSRKLIKKIEEALRRILLGLMSNTSLDTETLMYFVYGLLNDTFNALKNGSGPRKNSKALNGNPKNFHVDESKGLTAESSCLLLPKEPTRGGEKPKVQSKTNQHVIVEFALQLMNNIIKQNRISPSSSDDSNAKLIQMLDPYLPLFVDYLDGKHLKVTIITIRCLNGFLRYPLASIGAHSKQMAVKLFNLLKTYSGSSTTIASDMEARGDNFELLMVCYKLIATLIRDCATFNLSEEQLQALLHYAERNLYDSAKQASSFNLLKAIISRKLQCDELNDVLAKVMKLSIQADSPNVRLQSRQTILQYMLEYSLGEKKVHKFLEFYLVQLDYEYENGRESALEMLATVFLTFPVSLLNENASLFYVPLAIQLHNDESPKCKKLVWLALKSLLEKLNIEKRDALFTITLAWFQDNDRQLHKRIGALLVKLYVDVEKQAFERRLSLVMPILRKELDAKNFEEAIQSNLSSLISDKFYDQYLFNLLTLFTKMLNECKLFTDQYIATVNELFDQIKEYLIHEHVWVRLAACQLFGILFANYSVDDLFNSKKSYFNHAVSLNKFIKIRDLIDNLCIQLKAPILDNDLAEQIIKNLAYMGKMLKKYEYKMEKTSNGKHEEAQSEDDEDDEDEEKEEQADEETNGHKDSELKHNIDLEWLIRKVTREAKYEMVNKPKETTKRSCIFKLLAAISLELGDKLKDYLNIIVPCLHREIVIGQTDEQLKNLAQEVLDLIKQMVGAEEFSLVFSKSNRTRLENKEARKRKLAQAAIVDPQTAALKKIRKMQRKKEAKKRKIETKRDAIRSGKGTNKRKKLTHNNEDEEY